MTDALRHAWRRLRHSPGFSIVTMLTIALGIGANVAVFSALEPVLLRSLPVDRPDQLVLLHSAGTLATENTSERAAFERYSAERDVFAGVIADAGAVDRAGVFNNSTLHVRTNQVSVNYFSVLGLRPLHGRFFGVDDDVSRRPAVVLGFNYWTRTFGADASIVGQSMEIAGRPYTVIGVAPRGFSGLTIESESDVYLPFSAGSDAPAWMTVLGRLRPGMSMAVAQSQLAPAFKDIVAASSLPPIEIEQVMSRLVITPAARGLSDLRPALERPGWVLFVAVAIVLLVACGNVASLMLTRAFARGGELATRAALGASRLDLVREVAAESVLLATGGSALALLAARSTSGVVLTALSGSVAGLNLTSGIERKLLLVGALFAVTVMLSGVLPALMATRQRQSRQLRIGRTTVESGGSARSRYVLVCGQLGLSIVLLSGAGLLVHSFVNLESSDVGFNRRQVLVVSMSDTLASRPRGDAARFLNDLIERAKALPGVARASLAATAPLGDQIGVNVASTEGRTIDRTHTFMTAVTPDYFSTLGIPVIAGREFVGSSEPDGHAVVIINQTMARRYFGAESPIGRRLRFIEGNRPPIEVVGVAADSLYFNLRESSPNFLYQRWPRLETQARTVRAQLFVRTTLPDAEGLAAPIRQLVSVLDAGVRVDAANTLDTSVGNSLRRDRAIARMSAGCSLVALAVAVLGLYGILSAFVNGRQREIALRLALGASTGRVLWMVMSGGVMLISIGLILGGLGATVSTSLIGSLLFGVSSSDPWTIAGVVVSVLVAGAIACYLPARRAIRIDPAVLLRSE